MKPSSIPTGSALVRPRLMRPRPRPVMIQVEASRGPTRPISQPLRQQIGTLPEKARMLPPTSSARPPAPEPPPQNGPIGPPRPTNSGLASNHIGLFKFVNIFKIFFR